MAEEKKSSPKKPESKPSKSESTPTSNSVSQNGKGDVPRNIFSDEFRRNFESIDWSK